LAVVCHSPAEDESGDLKPLLLDVGFTEYSFLGMNRNDTEVAFKVFSETAAPKYGYDVTSNAYVFDDAESFVRAIKEGTVNLVVVDSWRFESLDIHSVVTPYFVPSEQGNVGKRYVLLTRRGSGLDKIEDLRGKSLVVAEIVNASLANSWLKTLFLSNGFGAPNEFFGQIVTADKPVTTVLPVFFGTVDACVVEKSGFDVMSELNPQVGNELQIVSASVAYVDMIICLRNDGWPSAQTKADLVDALSTLHTEPAGFQILTLFKTSRLVPFEDAHLESVKKLRLAYRASLEKYSLDSQTAGD